MDATGFQGCAAFEVEGPSNGALCDGALQVDATLEGKGPTIIHRSLSTGLCARKPVHNSATSMEISSFH